MRSVRELGVIDSLLSIFQKDFRPSISANWSLPQDVFESMMMDVTSFRISVADNESVSIVLPGAGERARNDISEVDLIEEANSIFEFKVEIGDNGTGDDYHNWLKTGSKGYTRVYRLLSNLLGRQDAYNLLPVMVVASYHTTYPVTAFASLLGHVLRYRSNFDAARPAQSEAYLVDHILGVTLTESLDIPKLGRLATEDPFAFVGTTRAMRQYIEESEHHPLNLLARRVWIDHSASDRAWIYYPHQFIKNYGHLVKDEIRDLQPPFTLLVYDSDEVPLSAARFLLSDIYRRKKVSTKVDPEERTEFQTYLELLYFRRVLTAGLFRDPKGLRRSYCHHEGCDYFNSGLCDEFIRIPDVASNCPFPRYLFYTIKRQYSKESNSLERIQSMGQDLRIKASHEDLVKLKEALYEKFPGVDLQEDTELRPGQHGEPFLIALIVALGGATLTKEVLETLRQRMDERAKEKKLEIIKLYLEDASGSRDITLEELMKTVG
jgi:hypothetical protein